jgi:outer membrane protein assembly factor BamA
MLVQLLLAALLAGQVLAAPAPQAAGVLADIRVQGNVVTSDEEVIRLAGVSVGDAVDAGTPARVEAALKASRHFAHVQVLERFASLSDPTALLLMIIVDEGPVKLKGEGADARIVRSGGPHLLFLPLLRYEDGYGFSYGAQFAKAALFGGRSRLSFPLTWGGDKLAGADLDRAFARGPLTRAQTSLSLSRRTNPFFDADDTRAKLSLRGERKIARHVTLGAAASAERVAFLGQHDRVLDAGADVVVDTRLDPFLARNALYARAAWDHVSVADGVSANRASLEGRGYVGLVRQTVLVVRALRESSDRPLPLYLKPLLGGIETLRGFGAGHEAGDTLVAGSAELRMPLTSPLNVGKLGVSLFADTGAAYDKGARLRDQTLERGGGGGLWFAAAVLRLNFDVAHGVGGSTRLHFGTSLSF